MIGRYSDEILRQDEHVLYHGIVHWWVYMSGITAIGLALAIVYFSLAGQFGTFRDIALMTSYAMFAYAGLSITKAFIRRMSTELIVTNCRVVAKLGLVRRHTFELNADKIEGVHMDQSILGRIMGFGNVVVQGTGAGITPIEMVQDPVDFRNAVGELISAR